MTNDNTQHSPAKIKQFLIAHAQMGVTCARCENELTAANADLLIKQHGKRGASVRLAPYCVPCRRVVQKDYTARKRIKAGRA